MISYLFVRNTVLFLIFSKPVLASILSGRPPTRPTPCPALNLPISRKPGQLKEHAKVYEEIRL